MPTRYRFLITARSGGEGGSNISMAEVQMRSSVGGVDETSNTGGTASAHHFLNATYAPSKAVDDSVNNQWNGAYQMDPVWWAFEFVSDVDIVEYVITSYAGAECMSAWDFQSHNGDDWETIYSESTTPDWGTKESRVFSVLSAPVATEAPVIVPASGGYAVDQLITITCGTPGSTIYYTEDGSDPTEASTEYTAPFALTDAKTIKAFAVADGADDSSIVSETYTITASQINIRIGETEIVALYVGDIEIVEVYVGDTKIG